MGKTFHGVRGGDGGSIVDGTVNATIAALAEQFCEFQRIVADEGARGRGRGRGNISDGPLKTTVTPFWVSIPLQVEVYRHCNRTTWESVVTRREWRESLRDVRGGKGSASNCNVQQVSIGRVNDTARYSPNLLARILPLIENGLPVFNAL